jgi:hypothetical protein
MVRLFNWQSVIDRAALDSEPVNAALSSISVNLIIDALNVMADKWRWVDDSEWDAIEAAVSLAVAELLTNIPNAFPAFIDEFDRADGALGNGWAVDGDFLLDGEETIEIVNEWAIAVGSTPSSALYDDAEFGPDLEMIASIVRASNGDVGFFFRLQDEFTTNVSGYGARIGENVNGAKIYRFTDNSAFTVIAENTSAPGYVTGDILRVTAIGDEITMYLTHNSVETEILTVTDTTFNRAGKVGMWILNDALAYERVELRTL